MSYKRIVSLCLVFILILSGCSKKEESNEMINNETPSSTHIETSDMFTNRDQKDTYNEKDSVLISLNGDHASCESSLVTIKENQVIITGEGTFILTGTLNDGTIIVNANEQDKLQLVFDNVSITSSTSAPLYILEADKVVVTLASDSNNYLENKGVFEAIDENNIDGTVFSKQDLSFNGSGNLSVISPSGHGIVCKDDLVFTGGSYTIQSGCHGIDANDSVRVKNSTLELTSGKDGIHVENTDDATLGFVYIESGSFIVDAQGDGISASSDMTIDGGSFDIVTGGGSVNGSKQTSDNWGNFMPGRPGMGNQGFNSSTSTSDDSSTSIKGLKATSNLTISNGIFHMDCADDAIHSNASITINGGTYTIATGDDAFHGDETLTINQGTINISESYEGLEALDILIAGGNITLQSSDDGLNCAGGVDSSGTNGFRQDDMFGGRGAMSSSSNGSILISGGNLFINASGDGIDANGTLEITGGYTVVVGPTQGDTATLDYDISANISGGTFIGTGASGMAQTFSRTSTQGVLAISVGTAPANTEFKFLDSDGKVLIQYTPELAYNVIIVSCPEMMKGESYTIQIDTISQTFNAS